MLSALLLAPLAVGALGNLVGKASVVCPVDVPLSCENTTVQTDTCCFNTPGGVLMQTQFWDFDPATGPETSWTIHGLWPDNCDGTYAQFCDPSREISNVTAILNATVPCTLKYMETYWKDNAGDDESFWEHEFNKHGTCISSLEPKCYINHQQPDEVVDYYTRTVRLFRTLPSYDWLAAAGIVPSDTKTYTLAEIQAALGGHRNGFAPAVNCNKNNELNELWYYYHVRGSVQDGDFVPIDFLGSATCKATGIKYVPKKAGSTPTSTASATGSATATATSTPIPGVLSGKGYLYVASGGFLISGGAWYRGGGTPATYTATPSGSEFTLTTSKGLCAVQADTSLLCAASVTEGSLFGYDGTYLSYNNGTTFYADATPSGTTQGKVYTGAKSVSLQVTWTAK